MLLGDSLKQSIYEIDAFLDNYTLGTLIISNGKPYLILPSGDALLLDDSFQIEVINDRKYLPISYKQAVQTLSTDGWCLYAGKQARVKGVTE